MASFRLSVKAEEDLVEIYTYGIFQFGYLQANNYVLGLEESLQKLAQFPLMGKQSDFVSKGLRLFVYKSHLIFYQLEEKGILIVRILNQSRDYNFFF
ncbi:type II toxin-antitoxin system RelE/ParE family toxin [Algoriphagus confluentis]|uniref:Toxin n=1 Tax=Algoriphagus confluentis TaxID=1697556 RepID=A0ABQ6PSD9_9BACT|nr:type II toxin-antitoxin system RelE/ParE family toxin [Algoriphagus confluentis]